MVGGGAGGRARLDRARHAEDAGRRLSRLSRAAGRDSGQPGDRADPDVPRGLCLCVRIAGAGAGGHHALRDRLAGQDQRHQCLCRIARLVELLCTPDAQPSGPRGVAGVQCGDRGAADDPGHLSGARACTGPLQQCRDRLGRCTGGRSGDQQAAGPEPEAHRIQAGLSLRHQPGRAGRDGGCCSPGHGGLCRQFRRHRAGLRALHRALRVTGGVTADCLVDQGPLLPRPPRPLALEARPAGHLLGLREPLRIRRHGAVSGLWRADLLAVLCAGVAVSRPLQDAVAHDRAGAGRDGRYAAGGNRPAHQRAHGPLPGGVGVADLAGGSDPGGGPRAELDGRWRPRPGRRHADAPGFCAAVARRSGGRLVDRARQRKPADGRRRVEPPEPSADARNRGAPAHRCRTAGRQGRRRSRQPGQDPLCGRHDP